MDTILLFMLPAGLWAQDAGVAATTAAPDATAGALGELATGLNTVWMLLAAMMVFFMQPGFALVEAGFIRTKNTANVLMKNLVDFMFGSILFWFIGFGLMFGIGGFVESEFLDSEHQYLPRPTMGTWTGNLWRGSLSDDPNGTCCGEWIAGTDL